jgi:adenylate cyclase
LDKYIGDGVMAVFGVPYPKTDDAKRAVLTSLEMNRALVSFNREVMNLGIDPIKIRIGISTGTVISGNIGSEKRMDFTVIGDVVNVASRLENLNKQYGSTILIEENTHREISDQFVTRPIDLVLIKGRTKPMEIYEAMGDLHDVIPEEKTFFAKGLEHYRKKEFTKALHYFNFAKDTDPPSQTFVQRCEHFIKNPPAGDWNFVWIPEQK